MMYNNISGSEMEEKSLTGTEKYVWNDLLKNFARKNCLFHCFEDFLVFFFERELELKFIFLGIIQIILRRIFIHAQRKFQGGLNGIFQGIWML